MLGKALREQRKATIKALYKIQDVIKFHKSHINGGYKTVNDFRKFIEHLETFYDNTKVYMEDPRNIVGDAGYTLKAVYHNEKDIQWYRNKFKEHMEEWSEVGGDEKEYKINIIQVSKDPVLLKALIEKTGIKTILNYTFLILWK